MRRTKKRATKPADQRPSKRRGRTTADGCIIPGPVPIPALKDSVLKHSDREAHSIREYVEFECQKDQERVSHLEKVATEHVFERKLDVWDVRTNRSRYWVITNPINLYSQRLFPSMDYTLSFHVGVTLRAWSMQKRAPDDQQQDRLASAWRRWGQATEALDHADEADDFQSVGMRCRECLLAMIRAVAKQEMVPAGQDVPKTADFIHWSELIADVIASGSGAKELRGYLKAVAKAAWQLVSWLTHASPAMRFDAAMAVEATQSTLAAFGAALVRCERGTPDQCPNCSSYRIVSVHIPDADIEPPYAPLCESCGWIGTSKP